MIKIVANIAVILIVSYERRTHSQWFGNGNKSRMLLFNPSETGNIICSDWVPDLAGRNVRKGMEGNLLHVKFDEELEML